MGWIDWLLGREATVDVADVIAPPFPTIEEQIAAAVAARKSWMSGIPPLPAVERGVELIASAVAQLNPVAFRDATPTTEQPRIVDRPDPWSSRYAFLHSTVRSMAEDGDAYWLLMDPDPDTGRPRSARVIPWREVTIEWKEPARLLPTYKWRGKTMTPGVDFLHIPMAPRAGDLHGISPLKAGAESLWGIYAAEMFAAGHFGGSGVPSGTINSPVALDKDEAARLKAQWMEAHAGPISVPAVLSGGVTYEPNAADPEKSQLVEARDFGVATVARVLGIPAPLLLVNTTGTSLTYANVAQLYSEFVRMTVQPLYLSPIEAAWSDLVPRNQSVRFDVGEISRIDIAGRYAVYQQGIAMGLYTAEQVAQYEGIRPPEQVPTPFVPISAPTVAEPEVPVA